MEITVAERPEQTKTPPKTEEPKQGRKSKARKIAVILLLACVVLAGGIVTGISVYVGLNLLHPKRDTIKDTPAKFGLASQNIQFKSSLDGITLKGWWVPAQKDGKTVFSEKTVIFSHGYGNARDMHHIHDLNLAKFLAGEGYNILLFDYRNSGESGGNLSSIGQNEKYDMLSAVSFARDSKQSKKIALIGWSMGASTAITAGVASKDVTGIIADSPFADLRAYLKVNLPVWSHLPDFPFTPAIMGIIPMISGVHPERVSPAKAAVSLGDKSLLLIHSRDDEDIPYHNSETIFQAVKDKSHTELWLTAKAGHVESFLLYPAAYEAKVNAFLKKCMG